MHSEVREYYRNAKLAAHAAKWPPDEAELVAQLRSAALRAPAAGKPKPFPVATAWGNLLSACQRALENNRLATDGPDIFATLATSFGAGAERDALARIIVERASHASDHPFVKERGASQGQHSGIDWLSGLPAVLMHARMLHVIGLQDEADDLAFEECQFMLELVVGYRGQAGERGARNNLELTIAKRPFARAGFSALQAWLDANVRAQLAGEPVSDPPRKSGSLENLFRQLPIAKPKVAKPKAAPPPPEGGYADWSDLND